MVTNGIFNSETVAFALFVLYKSDITGNSVIIKKKKVIQDRLDQRRKQEPILCFLLNRIIFMFRSLP